MTRSAVWRVDARAVLAMVVSSGLGRWVRMPGPKWV